MHGQQLTTISVATIVIYDRVLIIELQYTSPPIEPCISIATKFDLPNLKIDRIDTTNISYRSVSFYLQTVIYFFLYFEKIE